MNWKWQVPTSTFEFELQVVKKPSAPAKLRCFPLFPITLLTKAPSYFLDFDGLASLILLGLIQLVRLAQHLLIRHLLIRDLLV